MALTATSAAAAEGPDAWDVTGVAAHDKLNVHSAASARERVIGTVPADGKGLRNLGCTGVPTFQEYLAMSEAQRVRAGRARWCRIAYRGLEGWVSGRFLKEGAGSGAAKAVGPWSVSCTASTCRIEQSGLGGGQRTVLKIIPDAAGNARVEIERAGLPRRGTLRFDMDGEMVSAGPIAAVAQVDGKRLVMSPDDITAGLLKQMERHKTMAVSFPGAAKPVEFHLEEFAEARRLARP